MRDWGAFSDAHRRPEPTALRIRSGRIDPGELLSRLRERGFHLGPVPEVSGYYRVRAGPSSVAQTPEHWLGLFHVQQAVMGLPSLALAPQPGERVLDLCAAPGGKTAHLAELMSDQGPLVALDPKEKRLRALLGNLYRLAHPNVLVIAGDGRTLPDTARFDRVLVDAPCSAEGNYRRRNGRIVPRKSSFVAHITALQETLLRRAIRLTRPGGTIVYSTCTYAPEENEGVLHRVLQDAPVRTEPIRLEAPHARGITEWKAQRFHPGVTHAWRVYPHHLDSGGLFMARLHRLEDVDEEESEGGAGWSPVPAAFPGEDPTAALTRIDEALAQLRSRFGMSPEILDELGWMVRKENIWVHTAKRWPVASWNDAAGGGKPDAPKDWRVVALGLRGLRRGPGNWETPTNHFLARWGLHLSQERRISLRAEELGALLNGSTLPAEGRPPGPVALVWEGRVIGRGIVGRKGLTHQIAGAYVERLRAILSRNN